MLNNYLVKLKSVENMKIIVFFSLFSAILWSLISIRYLKFAGDIDTVFTYLYVILFFLGHFLTFSLVLLLIPFSFLALILPKNIWNLLLLFISLVVSIVLFTDTFVYEQYRFHINKAMVEMFLGPASRDIFVFSNTMYFLFFTIFVIFLILLFIILKISTMLSLKGYKVKYILFLSFIVITSYHIIHSYAKLVSNNDITRLSIYLPLAHPLSANKTLVKFGIKVPEELKISKNSSSGTLDYPKEPINCNENNDKKNILIIVIDSWRFDAFNEEITPNLYEFSKNADIFTNHFATANATRTGIFSLLYGISGTYWHSFLGERKSPVLIDELIKQNYEMSIFASANLKSPEFDQTVFVNVQDLQTSTQGDSPSVKDRNITSSFLDFLDKRDKSKAFFGFLFYDSAHAYEYPKDFEIKFKPNLEEVNYLALNNNYPKEPFVNKYKNSVLYIDSLLKNIFDELKSKNLDKDTIVIFTGDHGQEINDNNQNFWGHNGNFSRYQTQVPMIIVSPNGVYKTHSYRTSHFDIVPTLMENELNCINSYEAYSSGKNIFDSSKREPLVFASYSSRAFVEDELSIVIDSLGNINFLDLDMNKVVSPKNSGEIIKKSLEESRRFYK